MNSKSIKSLIESLLKTDQQKEEYFMAWKRDAYAGRKNSASANRANVAILSRKINFLKKQIHDSLNIPSYRVKLLVNGNPSEGFLNGISKEEIPYLYKIWGSLNNLQIKILEIEEITPFMVRV